MDDGASPESLLAEGKGLIPFSEVQKHNTAEDCWVVIDGKVYDLTEVRRPFRSRDHKAGQDVPLRGGAPEPCEVDT